MFIDQRARNARWMMRAGHSDEYVEKLTGLSLEKIIFLRATAAVEGRPDRSKVSMVEPPTVHAAVDH